MIARQIGECGAVEADAGNTILVERMRRNFHHDGVAAADGFLSDPEVPPALRRLVLEKISVAAGKSAEATFIVNLRTPQIGGTNRVHLKPREKASEIWDWDEKLTLELNGIHPTLRALIIAPTNVATVFLTGDSTADRISRE